MGFFKECFDRGRFEKSLKGTFLVLIPKKGGAEDLSNFRFISLMGDLCKILTKVSTKRLK